MTPTMDEIKSSLITMSNEKLDELDANDRLALETKIKERRERALEQRNIVESTLKEYETLKTKLLKHPALAKLKSQLENNEIISFFVPETVDDFTKNHYTRLYDKKLFVRFYHNDELIIDLNNESISIRAGYYNDPKDYNLDIYKSANKTITELSEKLNVLVDYNKERTDEETKKVKEKRYAQGGKDPWGIYKYFTEDNVNKMTLIKDIENGGHWAYGSNYYLFVFKGKLYHFEAYNRHAYILDRDTKVINWLNIFNEVENTGVGNYELPIIHNLYASFKTGRDGEIYESIDLNNLE